MNTTADIEAATAELADWVRTLPNAEALTIESIGAELRRRFDCVPGSWKGDCLISTATAAMADTYDEFRAEAAA